MRKMVVLLLVTISANSASAQLHWGASAGLNISGLTHVEDFTSKPLLTGQFSGFVVTPIGQSLMVQPTLGYRGKGCVADGRFYRDSLQHRINFTLNYLQLSAPVLLRCNVNDYYRLYAGAGPYLAYLLNGKWDDSHLSLDNYHRIDLGLDFSISLAIRKRWVIALASDLGLTSVHTNASSTNISSGITVGYLIY